MGTNMVRRLMRAGHQCVVYDLQRGNRAGARQRRCGRDDIAQRFAKKLKSPRAVWMMVPAAVVDPTLKTLVPLLESDDVVIDGGNSYYHDDIRRAAELKPKGIHYVDAGTSGGVWGSERGYCLMIGGDETIVRRIDPIFAALAPNIDEAPRTPGREKLGGTAEHGYLHCGPSGAGHFVKMVHNGIEYGMMASYAEGLNILRHANAGKQKSTVDAETTPLRDPEHYAYDLNLADIAEVWRRGSVISSWLLDLAASALLDSPDLAKFAGRVSDSGEGRWTIKAAIDESVPAPVLSAALTNASVRAAKTTSPTRCCRLFVTSSAAMRKKPPPRRRVPDGHLPFGCAGVLWCDGRSCPQDDLPGALRDGETRHLKVPVIGVAFRSGAWIVCGNA